MHEFKTFVYLDVQKTGSTFISTLLENFFPEQEVRKRRHIGVGKEFDNTKLYFISVRDPLDQYVSLYSYGCETKGKIFWRLYERKLGDLYNGTWDGFCRWLDFVLKAENAPLVNARYSRAAGGRLCKLIGFQSYRVLLLALPDAEDILAGCEDREAIRQEFREKKLHRSAVRYENFRSDLVNLLRIRLRDEVADMDAAVAFVENSKPSNASERVDRNEANPRLGEDLQRQLREREWLLYEEFDYQLPAAARLADGVASGAGAPADSDRIAHKIHNYSA